MSSRANTRKSPLLRHALTGAAIGLYFGLFFRPAREPSLLVIFGLSALAAFVMLGLRLLRGWRPGFRGLVRAVVVTYAQYAFLLAVLEGRHLANAAGGKVLVVVMTTLLGAVAGIWFGRDAALIRGGDRRA